jgi:hypothetical protein
VTQAVSDPDTRAALAEMLRDIDGAFEAPASQTASTAGDGAPAES